MGESRKWHDSPETVYSGWENKRKGLVNKVRKWKKKSSQSLKTYYLGKENVFFNG